MAERTDRLKARLLSSVRPTKAQEERFLRHMRQMFGDKSCYVLSVRPEGATLVF